MILQRVDCPMVRAAIDPAELIMDGSNPVATVPMLADRIAIGEVPEAPGPDELFMSVGTVLRAPREIIVPRPSKLASRCSTTSDGRPTGAVRLGTDGDTVSAGRSGTSNTACGYDANACALPQCA